MLTRLHYVPWFPESVLSGRRGVMKQPTADPLHGGPKDHIHLSGGDGFPCFKVSMTGFEPAISRTPGGDSTRLSYMLFTLAYLPLTRTLGLESSYCATRKLGTDPKAHSMEDKGVEPLLPACKAGVLPLSLIPRVPSSLERWRATHQVGAYPTCPDR